MIELENWGIIDIFIDKDNKNYATVTLRHKRCGKAMSISIVLDKDDLNSRYMKCFKCDMPIPNYIRTAVSLYAITL